MQVKFIKFFAWEDRWIERALDAREAEMKWMIKGTVFFHLTLTFRPSTHYLACSFPWPLDPILMC